MNYITKNENEETRDDGRNLFIAKISIVLISVVVAFFVGLVFINGNAKLSQDAVEQEKTIRDQKKRIQELEQNKKEIEVAEDVTVVSTEMCKFMIPAKRLIIDDYTYVHSDEYTKELETIFGNLGQKDIERITYTGKMGIGIDFDKISYEIDQDEDEEGNPKNSGRIVIHLPNPKIQTHVIVNNTFRADSVRDSWMVSSDAEEYEQFKLKMKIEEESKVLQNENVWRTTRDNTEKTFDRCLEPSNLLKKYRVYYKWDGDMFNVSQKPKVDRVNHTVTGSTANTKA